MIDYVILSILTWIVTEIIHQILKRAPFYKNYKNEMQTKRVNTKKLDDLIIMLIFGSLYFLILGMKNLYSSINLNYDFGIVISAAFILSSGFCIYSLVEILKTFNTHELKTKNEDE